MRLCTNEKRFVAFCTTWPAMTAKIGVGDGNSLVPSSILEHFVEVYVHLKTPHLQRTQRNSAKRREKKMHIFDPTWGLVSLAPCILYPTSKKYSQLCWFPQRTHPETSRFPNEYPKTSKPVFNLPRIANCLEGSFGGPRDLFFAILKTLQSSLSAGYRTFLYTWVVAFQATITWKAYKNEC